MTQGETLTAISKIIPGMQVEQDNDGQIIIYTNLKPVNTYEQIPDNRVNPSLYELVDMDDPRPVAKGFWG